MSRELHRFYRSLAQDTDPGGLVPPALVRRYADRRARLRAAAGVLAVAALVGGTAAGTRFVSTAAPSTPAGPPSSPSTSAVAVPAPAVSPAATMTSVPTASAPTGSASRSPARTVGPTVTSPAGRPPTAIPDAAFFTLAAANDTGMRPTFTTGPALPQLCGAHPGDAGVVQRRGRALAFRYADTPKGYVPDGSYRHTITLYRAGRAEDVLDELRAAVRDCPVQQSSDTPGVTSRYRLLGGGGYGDESVLFELRRSYSEGAGDPAGEDEIRLVRAIRLGDVVTVLWEQGWEGTSSDRSQVDADSRRAVDALRDWLD
ncbi:hypothetical protein [Micromonospora sp. HUAS LYJ1]|uniref:hypothetical protein n=1 Tax=Micromonospora sp. HUAS LYJ1 TaxID=3061626 RepID=UPI0026716DC2|nr:hypothetical protein [Micromonospora sp. HUAS LYJ1]WKU08275.1 hypothetical protein Q2K16_15225 [Micromonospora sp. HUAS LYJ1]